MFPEMQFTAQGHDVDSGVSDQPMGGIETLQGATNRARALIEIFPAADFFVGIEGGVETIDETLFASAWNVIIDAQGFSTKFSNSTILNNRAERLARLPVV